MIEHDSTLVTRSWHVFTCASSCVVHYTPFQPEGKTCSRAISHGRAQGYFHFVFQEVDVRTTHRKYQTNLPFRSKCNYYWDAYYNCSARSEIISFAGFCSHMCICKCSLDKLRYIWIWYATWYIFHMCIYILCMCISSNITFEVKQNCELFIF